MLAICNWLIYYFVNMKEELVKVKCPESVIDRAAEKLKVCGHPLRLRILCLIETQDACVSDLWQCLHQSQPVISQHLAVLKEKEIVSSEIQGNKRIYSVVDPFIKSIIASLDDQ